jgi:hypothetical protein
MILDLYWTCGELDEHTTLVVLSGSDRSVLDEVILGPDLSLMILLITILLITTNISFIFRILGNSTCG